MDHVRKHIYLAAMLHDIGKFYQRADDGSVQNSRYLNDACRRLEHFICPSFRGVTTHKHVLWTAQFIMDFNAVFNNLVAQSNLNLAEKDNLLNLAACHHLSYEQLSSLGRIIKEADCLSSGMDRDSDIALRDDTDERGRWDDFKRKRLIPITATVSKQTDELESLSAWREHLHPLSLSNDSFPTNDQNDDCGYQALWEKFIGEFRFIQANTYKAFSETLLSVLFKYTSCIPSSTINFRDVSLYDHLKTTAALAICLYDVYTSEENPENPFLLIGGDLSGIQPYIYHIVSKYAAKNLKGRSFYLRLITDTVVHYLLDKLNLFQSNIVYNSGGGFYLLAPNTSKCRQALKEAVSTIEEKLLEAHGISLFLAIDSVELSKNALMHRDGADLGQVWRKLFDKKEEKKNARFSTLIQNDYERFFTPFQEGGEEPVDVVSGEYFANGEKQEREGDLSPLRQVTKDQIRLGRVLRDFDSMVISDGPLPFWNEKVHIEPLHLGVHYYFVDNEDLEKKRDALRTLADKVTVVTLNGNGPECNFLGMVRGINNIYQLQFYGGNGVHKGITFNDMCEKLSEDAFKRMGILRMDVDNLGHIFQKGIAPERSTLSRMSALSRSFDYFFSGYLNTIWQEVDPEHSFILYSGGDDVFIVGSWDVAIQLAERIRADFRRFTCENPAFSISGGIAIVGSSFPLIKGAELSAGEESNAKGHSCRGKNKNSLSLMGIALNFDEEFPQVKALAQQLEDLIRADDGLSKSFISKVLQHWSDAKIEKHEIGNFKTYWMMTYDLGRMMERLKKNNGDAKDLIRHCKNEVCTRQSKLNGQDIISDYHPLELWALACRWAELQYRTNG